MSDVPQGAVVQFTGGLGRGDDRGSGTGGEQFGQRKRF